MVCAIRRNTLHYFALRLRLTALCILSLCRVNSIVQTKKTGCLSTPLFSMQSRFQEILTAEIIQHEVLVFGLQHVEVLDIKQSQRHTIKIISF